MMHYVTCKIKFTFYAEDGSFVESTIVGEAMDTGDKATNKAMAIAYKYACFQVFCIPTADMVDDPDAESPEARKTNEQSTADAGKSLINEEMVRRINAELSRTGVRKEQIFALFGVDALEKLNILQYNKAMKKLQKTPNAVEMPTGDA